MKRFTILFSILLALGFGAVLAYVAASPEELPDGISTKKWTRRLSTSCFLY